MTTATPTTAPAAPIHREWKGERGQPVLVTGYGLVFRARFGLREMLAEFADRGGGPDEDATGALRALRLLARRDGPATEPELVAALGDTPWCAACRELCIRRLIVRATPAPAPRAYMLPARIALQLARQLEDLPMAWEPVVERRWEAGELLVVREGMSEGPRLAARDVVARLFDLSEAERGLDHDGLWSACRALAGAAGADSPAPSARAAVLLAHHALSGAGAGAPAGAPEGFAAAVRQLSLFAVPR